MKVLKTLKKPYFLKTEKSSKRDCGQIQALKLLNTGFLADFLHFWANKCLRFGQKSIETILFLALAIEKLTFKVGKFYGNCHLFQSHIVYLFSMLQKYLYFIFYFFINFMIYAISTLFVPFIDFLCFHSLLLSSIYFLLLFYYYIIFGKISHTNINTVFLPQFTMPLFFNLFVTQTTVLVSLILCYPVMKLCCPSIKERRYICIYR